MATGAGRRTESLRVERRGRVRILTLSRPERRNAIDAALSEALVAAIHDVDADDDAGVTIITGEDPAFCAGFDLSQLAPGAGDARERPVTRNVAEALLAAAKPVIGAINGACVTGGLEIALACDFLVASENARFADTHVQLGVLPSWGGTALFPQAVGIRRAKELALTGRFFSAEEAMAYGLVTAVVPHDQLMEHALAVAETIGRAPSSASTSLVELYDQGDGAPRRERLEIERKIAAEVHDSAREALTDRYRGGT